MNNNLNVLGIDIGSIALSVAELGPNKEIINTAYLFHNGDITDNIKKLLGQFDLTKIGGIAVSSSSPDIFKNAVVYDSRISFITAAKHLNDSPGSLLIVGGEKFGLALFDDKGNYLNYRSNTSCAAGTGSFLDQQAGRLNLSGIEEFSRVAFKNTGPVPKIASRCAVFAKTDLIHAQQEGFSLEEICDGLSLGLAKNIVDTLFHGIDAAGPVIFAGGVSKNKAVVKHISQLVGMEIQVHEFSHLYGAIGAACCLLDEGFEKQVSSLDDILSYSEKKKTYEYEPLQLQLSEYPDFESLERYIFESKIFKPQIPVEVDIYETLNSGEVCPVYLGIDIGSTSTKAVLVNESKQVLAGFYTGTSGRPVAAVQTIFESIDELSRNKNITLQFSGVGTTGSGRKFIGKIIGAYIALDEITAHARAAFELNEAVDTIIEIGGQDAKFTTLRHGRVTFSIMNSVCAAGTGSFIEEQAKRLNTSLEEYAPRAEKARAPLASDRCTVFMERDVNHFLSEGYSVNEALASTLHSVRDNYLTKVAIESNIGDSIFFQGATAKNRALVAAFEQRLNKPILVSKFCHLTGAIGVALYLHDYFKKSGSNNRYEHEHDTALLKETFRGLDIYHHHIPVSTEVCELCANHCKIKIADLPAGDSGSPERVAFGFLCGRDYATEKYVNLNASDFDLLKERKKVFAFKPSKRKTKTHPVTLGIPAALYLFEEMPLWKKFFDILSIPVVSSESYRHAVKDGKQLAGAELCAPITALYGHVQYLAERADYIFLPVYLELKPKKMYDMYTKRQYCYYTQFAPSIVSLVKDESIREKILSPLVRSVQGPRYMKIQLYKMLNKILSKKISYRTVSSAYDRAAEWYGSSLKELKEVYSVNKESAGDDIQVVFLGRPYSILAPSMNSGIPEIFAKMGIKTFFQDMLSVSPEETTGIDPLLKAFHWQYAAGILEAAEYIANTKGVYPVMVTSFKCAPDSFTVEYFKTLMDFYEKPYLILQLDELDSSVGYETRIEAAARSFRNHHRFGHSGITRKHNFANPDVSDDVSILEGKTLLMLNWDTCIFTLLAANLSAEGIETRLVDETPLSIHKSLSLNTGQCIPLTAATQAAIDYIEDNALDPAKTILWIFDSTISCNIRMYPYYTKKLLQSHGNGLENVSVYIGDLLFMDLSLKIGVNSYLIYMFGGMLRKMGCRIRPYETITGATDDAINQSLEILVDTFRSRSSKEGALKKVIALFEAIPVKKTSRPKVAIFGDLYVRDNDVFNQGLIRTIEENGGEVITTPYNEYLKIIAGSYLKKWISEGYYAQAVRAKLSQKTISIIEKKYYKYFNKILGEPQHNFRVSPGEILSKLNVKNQNTGESMDNLLKIFSLIEQYPDISLFVQTNPSYCCPSLITEAMAAEIERLTGVPVVTIEYDGTEGTRNDVVIPYLKYARK